MKNSFFSSSYPEARDKFLAAARNMGGEIRHIPHPVEGLFMDVARFGPARAARLLIIGSGTHGIEGYVGSAIQTEALATGYLEEKRPPGTAVLYVHAHNPWGFDRGSRTDDGNVDINRNFLDWTQPLPVEHHLTARANKCVMPKIWRWPNLRLMAFAAAHPAEVQAAFTQGQYHLPDGLFYGGTKPVWSNTEWRKVLRDEAAGSDRIVHVDIHSGLGERGHGELIVGAAPNPAELARAQAIWGTETVRSPFDGSSVSAVVTGDILGAVHAAVPGGEVTTAALEFGTVPPVQVLEALALDNWLRAKGAEAPEALHEEGKRKMRDAFCPDDPAWQGAVLTRGREALTEAQAALAR